MGIFIWEMKQLVVIFETRCRCIPSGPDHFGRPLSHNNDATTTHLVFILTIYFLFSTIVQLKGTTLEKDIIDKLENKKENLKR